MVGLGAALPSPLVACYQRRIEAGCCKDRTWNRMWHSPGQVWHASMELGMGTVSGPGSVAHKPCVEKSNTQ